MNDARFYEIRFPVERPGLKKRWIRIGSATALEGGGIACTIEAVPLNWTGEFFLFPSEKKPA